MNKPLAKLKALANKAYQKAKTSLFDRPAGQITVFKKSVITLVIFISTLVIVPPVLLALLIVQSVVLLAGMLLLIFKDQLFKDQQQPPIIHLRTNTTAQCQVLLT